MKWLGSKVEETGITVFTGFAGSELLFDERRVAGVRTDDKGVDKEGQPEIELRARLRSARPKSSSSPKARADR